MAKSSKSTKKKPSRALGGRARRGQQATAAKARVARKAADFLTRAISAVPDNWIDPLLTGPNAVIGKPPYDCRDIERLILAVRARIERLK